MKWDPICATLEAWVGGNAFPTSPYAKMSYELQLHNLAVEALESGELSSATLFRVMYKALNTFKWRSGKYPRPTPQPQVVPRTGT